MKFLFYALVPFRHSSFLSFSHSLFLSISLAMKYGSYLNECVSSVECVGGSTDWELNERSFESTIETEVR